MHKLRAKEKNMLTLKKEEKRALVQIVKGNFSKYYRKYQSSKYPEKPYVEWKKKFPIPKNVKPEDIKQALEWKYGNWGKSNYPLSHKIIVSKVQKNWDEFVELNNYEIESIFAFWRSKLIEHQNFITIAFITHLIHNSTIEIIDQHGFRAMNYLFSAVRPSWIGKKNPSDTKDIRNYSEFFKMLLSLLDINSDEKRKLDKFLMMFGKHKAKDIDESKIEGIRKGKRVEPEQSSLTSDVFDFRKILLRANADKLFKCLLKSLEKDYGKNIPKKMLIRDISNRIPIGTENISNYSSYNYAMIALFGGQRGRDYFLFEDPKIKEFFTEQANNPLRDNNFWRKYSNEWLTINPKYIL